MSDWALITGASVGIGRDLAWLFAADHFNLALVARNEAQLDQLAAELRSRHGIQTRVIAKDLAGDKAPEEIFRAMGDTPVAILVNNAGFGSFGDFVESKLDTQIQMMQVNMTALVRLTHWFAPPMVSRRAGRILNVASVAGYVPGPRNSIYYATKAFVHSFSVALGAELKGTGVTVTALCPGATSTEFHQRAGMRPTLHQVPMMNSRVVAKAGYRALMKGKPVVIPGASNKIICGLAGLVPASFTARIVRRLNRT